MIAEVIVDIAHSDVDKIFDYACDDTLKAGMRVAVPFGRSAATGFVMRVKEETSVPKDKLKKVFRAEEDFPALTEERRKELAKDVKKKGENAKVAIRNIRRDGNDTLKKLSKSDDISEDEIHDLENELQKLTDKYIANVDKAVDEKSKEILTV